MNFKWRILSTYHYILLTWDTLINSYFDVYIVLFKKMQTFIIIIYILRAYFYEIPNNIGLR